MGRKDLKTASKASIYRNNVKKLSTLGKSKDGFNINDVQGSIEKACGDFIERVLENINSIPNFVTTGKITEIFTQATETGVDIMASPHLIYQSRGVSGTETKYDTPHSFKDKMPPAKVFEDWVKRKGINLRDNEKYSKQKAPFKDLTQDDKIKSASWAIAMSIYKNGIEPKNIYEKEIPKLVEDLKKEIMDFMIQNIEQQIAINPRDGGKNRIITLK